ncbi:MAG TPA: MFS transporter [Aquabacterium sp.]|uniref:MFS transporter n=1 Tax=Aquabacterium sp. TaxID=1872578 RepID=UPI002E366D7A|nr:MFS transporter [Aquabacterium sp.]HEX5371638.1 MFS transporter [Aquabacterium sp.]
MCGALVVTLSMGIRHGFGLWLAPITMDRDWSRETFSLAMAIQNLVWGAAGPIVGWWADRKGAIGVLLTGAVLYALGLIGMATSTDVIAYTLSSGVMIGCAQACTTYSVVYGVIGRHVDASQRSWAMGITAAAGSFGQFLMVPLSSTLMDRLGWQGALWGLAASALLIVPVAWGLRADRPRPLSGPPGSPASSGLAEPQGAGAALREALTHPSYLLLTGGYFVCGFQLAFIGVHLPSYLQDHQLPPGVATTALALIGLFNVLGTYSVGWLGQRLSKPHVLAGIYFSRAVAMLIFIALPPTPLSVGLFAAVMGTLWLSTVPPTNAIVAQMLGVRHLSMLSALVFLSHQIGSFLGVWLAGRLYDLTGGYQVVWWLAIALGLLAAALNLPVRENEPPRGRLAAPA